jgi:hypothetical protein
LPAEVALKPIVPAPVTNVVPATNDIDPLIFNVATWLNATVPAETVISRQVIVAPSVVVTVYVPAWSKNTESAAVGAVAPLLPPDDADQWVVVVFQVPAPPTQ